MLYFCNNICMYFIFSLFYILCIFNLMCFVFPVFKLFLIYFCNFVLSNISIFFHVLPIFSILYILCLVFFYIFFIIFLMSIFCIPSFIIFLHFYFPYLFSSTRHHWAELVIESPCPDVCGSAPSGAVFF